MVEPCHLSRFGIGGERVGNHTGANFVKLIPVRLTRVKERAYTMIDFYEGWEERAIEVLESGGGISRVSLPFIVVFREDSGCAFL